MAPCQGALAVCQLCGPGVVTSATYVSLSVSNVYLLGFSFHFSEQTWNVAVIRPAIMFFLPLGFWRLLSLSLPPAGQNVSNLGALAQHFHHAISGASSTTTSLFRPHRFRPTPQKLLVASNQNKIKWMTTQGSGHSIAKRQTLKMILICWFVFTYIVWLIAVWALFLTWTGDKFYAI